MCTLPYHTKDFEISVMDIGPGIEVLANVVPTSTSNLKFKSVASI